MPDERRKGTRGDYYTFGEVLLSLYAGQAVTARQIAEEHPVSRRTAYRVIERCRDHFPLDVTKHGNYYVYRRAKRT